MKKLILLAFLIVSVVNAQETIQKKLGDFSTLKLFNGLSVELKKSSSARIEISGSNSEDVVIKNADGILKIRLKFPDSFTAEDVRITVFYSDKIDVLDANEGSTIFSEEKFKQQHLEVKVQEGARIHLRVKTNHLVVKSVSGGLVELSGTTKNQTVEATTGGIYEAFELKSNQTIITAASGAFAEVNAIEVLDAKVRFGGRIHYTGTPEVLKTKKTLGGAIKDKN